jgi:hypothetical protein
MTELAFHGIHTSRLEKSEKCNPCVRYEMSPMSRAAHRKTYPTKSGLNATMAEADLDAVIRSIARKQHKIVMDAVRKRHDRWMGMAAKAKDKAAKARYKHLAKATLLLAAAAARRMQIAADNAADSYARAIKRAAEEQPAKKAAKKKTG